MLEPAIFCLELALMWCTPGSIAADDQDRGARGIRRRAGPKGPVPSDSPDKSSAQSGLSWEYFRKRYDNDGDELVARAEYPRPDAAFSRLDADGSGAVSRSDFLERERANWGHEKKEYVVAGDGPRLGDLAPDFKLTSTDGEEFDLARFRGRKPVVLIFGSFT